MTNAGSEFHRCRATAAAILLLLLAGCTPFQPQRAEPVATHLLDASIEATPAGRQGTLTLAVGTPQAAPGFDTARIAYMRRPHELEYFARNEWVDTPSRMLAPLLVRALEQGGDFRAVVSAPGVVAGNLRLDTEIVRLQQEFDTVPSRVRFTLRARLIDPAERRVVRTRLFDVTEAAPSDDPRGAVAAANRAVARVLEELVGFCAAPQ